MPSDSTRRALPTVLSPTLRRLLDFVLILFGLLAVNSLYLVGVTVAESASGGSFQNYFYLLMFLAHLALGLALLIPALVFGALHLAAPGGAPTATRYAPGSDSISAPSRCSPPACC